MDNLNIQSLWIGSSLSNVEQLCIKSYLANGHNFHLYVYDFVKNVPEHTTLLDANQIIPHSNIFLDSAGSYGAFSDLFRYTLLYEKGGMWVDTDNICIKHYDFQAEFCFSSEATNDGLTVNTGVIKSPPKAEYLEDCLSYIDQGRGSDVPWGAFGPSFFRAVLSNYDYLSFLKPPEVFCPVPYQDFKDIFEKDLQISSETYSIHLWNEMWRREGLNKDDKFPENCTLERLKNRYL